MCKTTAKLGTCRTTELNVSMLLTKAYLGLLQIWQNCFIESAWWVMMTYMRFPIHTHFPYRNLLCLKQPSGFKWWGVGNYMLHYFHYKQMFVIPQRMPLVEVIDDSTHYWEEPRAFIFCSGSFHHADIATDK